MPSTNIETAYKKNDKKQYTKNSTWIFPAAFRAQLQSAICLGFGECFSTFTVNKR